MLTFSKLEQKGHLGNQLFQIASVIGIAELNNQPFCFPKWKYSSYFENELPVLSNEYFTEFLEKQFHYSKIKLENINYDLEGWFQSEKYFDLEKTKYYFKFKKEIIVNIKNQFKELLDKKTILISIRRGDFVDHKDYFQLPILFYINALITNFENWREHNIIFMSDDINYCKYHFSFLDNAFFCDNISGIEQLALASLCNHFIISNSTFSWWCAWLGEKKGSKIIRPFQNFTKEKNNTDNDKNFFPERWTTYNHLEKKLDLGNTLITINKKNTILEDYINHNFSFNKIINLTDFNIKENQLNVASVIDLQNYIVPPFSLYDAVNKCISSEENYKFYLKGKAIKISRNHDKNRLYKQFDFGVFTKKLHLINNKDSNKDSNKILFKVLSKEDFLINLNTKNDIKIHFNKKQSFAIEIKGFFYVKKYLEVKKTSLIKSVKAFIKGMISK